MPTISFAPVAAAVVASGVLPTAPQGWEPDPEPVRFTVELPVEFGATDAVTGGVGFYRSEYQGRLVTAQEYSIGAAIGANWLVWYSRTDWVAKGRNRANRFSAKSDRIGVEYRWGEKGEGPWAARFEYIKGGTGTSRTTGGTSTFSGPSTYILTGYYSPQTADEWTSAESVKNAYRLKLGGLEVRTPGNSSQALLLGGTADLRLSEQLTAGLDATAFFERPRGLVTEGGTKFKTAFTGSLTYRPVSWGAIELNGLLMPSGAPFGGTSITGLSSYLVYEPGGGAAGLRSDTLGFFSIRFLVGTRF